MAYIARAGSPINAATYETVEAALAAFTAPRWAGDNGAEITRIDDTSFRSSGQVFTIEPGDNPKTPGVVTPAKVAAPDAATTAQWRYLNDLSRRVPASAYEHWVKSVVTKADASRAIAALQTIASY